MDNVRIIRSKRRTVGIQIMPDGSIRVTIPYFYPKFLVNKILKEKEAWILEKQRLVRMRHKEKNKEEYFYLGKSYPLAVGQNQKALVEVSDKLYVASANKKFVKTYLTSWYKQQAQKIIVERVHHYSKIADLTFASIKITSAETRWGSCSSQKTLNFNWKLIMAPLPVIDYVIAHELAHLKELNHSRMFWETVRKIYPLYREHRTWLKRHGHMLTI